MDSIALRSRASLRARSLNVIEAMLLLQNQRPSRFHISFGLCADLRGQRGALPRIDSSIPGQRGLGCCTYAVNFQTPAFCTPKRLTRLVVSMLELDWYAYCPFCWVTTTRPLPAPTYSPEPICMIDWEPPRTAARSSWLSSVVTARSLMFISILRKSQSW